MIKKIDKKNKFIMKARTLATLVMRGSMQYERS